MDCGVHDCMSVEDCGIHPSTPSQTPRLQACCRLRTNASNAPQRAGGQLLVTPRKPPTCILTPPFQLINGSQKYTLKKQANKTQHQRPKRSNLISTQAPSWATGSHHDFFPKVPTRDSFPQTEQLESKERNTRFLHSDPAARKTSGRPAAAQVHGLRPFGGSNIVSEAIEKEAEKGQIVLCTISNPQPAPPQSRSIST